MSVTPILPIDGVPANLTQVFDNLVRILNDRFRQVDSAAQSTTTASEGAVSSAKIWKAPFSQQPTTNLSVQDEGFLWYVSDYAHLLRWTGKGWEFVDGEGGKIEGRTDVPTGTGWQLCNGTATHRLKVTAGVVSEFAFTTPNITGSPGAYLKWAAAYTGSIVAAVGPSVTVAGRGTTGSTAVIAVGADAEPAHLNLLPYYRR